MRTTLLLSLASVTLAFTSTQAQPSSVTYDLRGTYAGNVPVSGLSAPGAAFDLEFIVPASPLPASSDEVSFSLVPSSFRFSLDGQAVTAGLTGLTFFSAVANGGFTAGVVTAGDAAFLSLDLSGTPLFGGTPQAPAFQVGAFAVEGAFAVDTGSPDGPFDLTVNNLTLAGQAAAPVPEPSGAVMTLGLGAALALGLAARGAAARRRSAVPLTPA